MKIKEVRYGRTFYLGNFQTERLDVMAEVEEGEDPAEAVSRLKHFCHIESQTGQRKQSGNPIAIVEEADDLTNRLLAETKASRKKKGAIRESKNNI